MFVHDTKIRVRYGETDQMGYLYYGNYAEYYEVGRVEALRTLGVTYRDMEAKHQVMMPVMSLEMRFVRPALYDELLTVRTAIKEYPLSNIVFEMEIFNENNKLVNGGRVKLCFIDANTRRRIDTPSFLLESLKPYFSTT
jgi:acyl-CoA thioester hydrolase